MANPEKLRPKFGTHVTGTGYWRGTPTPESLADRLEDGESIKSFGLRRIGKSSLMQETARQLETRRRLVIRLDGQQLHSIPGLLKDILAKLPQEKGLLHRLLDWSNKVGLPPAVKAKFEALVTDKIVGISEPSLDAYAELLFKELGAAFASLAPNQRPLLFIDELPFFCDNVMKAAAQADRHTAASRLNNLLAVLRAWRGEEIGVAMAICGSLSMAWLQREHDVQTDHLNDCLPFEVEELAPADTVAMIRALIAHVGPMRWEEGIAERLTTLLPARFPGVVQFAFSMLRDKPALTVAMLEQIHRGAIADGLQDNYYSQFDKRIGHYDKEEQAASYKIFAAILAAGDSVAWPAAESLCGVSGRVLLDRLGEDGFIRSSRTAGIRFASGLAQRWYRGGE